MLHGNARSEAPRPGRRYGEDRRSGLQRGLHTDASDVHRVDLQRVPVEDNEVSELASLDGALIPFLEELACRIVRDCLERKLGIHALFRAKDLAAPGDPIDGCPDQEEHVGRDDRGEQQMLAFGRALMVEPRVLLLDEPSIGLAPMIEEQLMASIREASQQLGMAVLLVEQSAMLALDSSHQAYVLELGRVVQQGPSADLINDPDIISSYLGG
jgi:hypothetical protein